MADDQAGAQWYYAEGGKSVGPIAEDVFDAMAADGRIAADALVWREGMEGWKPLRDVRAAAPTAQGASPETCSQCGRPFPASDLIRFGDSHVCAACKPAFVQRLQEDAEVPAALVYGGFWIRVAATFIDSIVVSIAQYAVYIPVILVVFRNAGSEEDAWQVIAAQLAMALFSIVLTAGYEIWMVGRYGATLGKMACRLRVVAPDGSRISYARATGRHFAKYISYFTMYIGFIIAGFDREKRGLHDMICNTRIVKV
jgi:uncharacterized RDD family membrane protein YckC